MSFEKAKADVVLMLDLGQQMYTSMTYSVQYSLAANMQRAGMNTLMGIGIVFLMLLFLSFVIGLPKNVPLPHFSRTFRLPVRSSVRSS